MVNKENLHKIKKISIGDPEEFKKVEIYFDILNYKLFFIGLSASKTTGVVKTWKEFVVKEVDFNKNLTYDFESAVRSIYDEMIEKEKTLEIINNLFKDIDSLEFRE